MTVAIKNKGNAIEKDLKTEGIPMPNHCATNSDEPTCCRTTLRAEAEKKALLNRCSRLEGQIRGVRGMIERDVYCDDILNQISAAQSALQGLSRLILENHLKSCIVNRIEAGEYEVVDELLGTIQKMMK